MEITHIYFGGSFYPPHKAHTEMLQLALKAAPEAELLIVPTKQNPLKSTPGAEISLINAWIEDLGSTLSYQEFSRCRLETIELQSVDEKNYTVKTLKKLISPNEQWALLLGSDSAVKFKEWKEPKEILSLLDEVWIVPRGHKSENETETQIKEILHSLNPHCSLRFFNKVTDISSSQIRDGALSQPLNEFLSPKVLSVWKQL
ncbi:MAG: nicotinate-nicotinamide nucleotide adenylyltransferase [Bdellovibrionota bacterium]